MARTKLSLYLKQQESVIERGNNCYQLEDWENAIKWYVLAELEIEGKLSKAESFQGGRKTLHQYLIKAKLARTQAYLGMAGKLKGEERQYLWDGWEHYVRLNKSKWTFDEEEENSEEEQSTEDLNLATLKTAIEKCKNACNLFWNKALIVDKESLRKKLDIDSLKKMSTSEFNYFKKGVISKLNEMKALYQLSLFFSEADSATKIDTALNLSSIYEFYGDQLMEVMGKLEEDKTFDAHNANFYFEAAEFYSDAITVMNVLSEDENKEKLAVQMSDKLGFDKERYGNLINSICSCNGTLTETWNLKAVEAQLDKVKSALTTTIEMVPLATPLSIYKYIRVDLQKLSPEQQKEFWDYRARACVRAMKIVGDKEELYSKAALDSIEKFEALPKVISLEQSEVEFAKLKEDLSKTSKIQQSTLAHALNQNLSSGGQLPKIKIVFNPKAVVWGLRNQPKKEYVVDNSSNNHSTSNEVKKVQGKPKVFQE